MLIAGHAAPANADVAAGVAAYLQQDYAAALRQFEAAAKQDDARALNYLGIMHADGIGTARDDGQAATLFSKAALLGLPEAMANLARLHAEGRGVPRDPGAAVAAYRGAARAGFPPAIERMAEIYEKGELGESPNPALAREWRARLAAPSTASRTVAIPPPAPARTPPPATPAATTARTPQVTAAAPATTVPPSAPPVQSAPLPNAIDAVAVTLQPRQILIRVRTRLPLASPPFGFGVTAPPRIAFDFPQTETSLGRHHPVGEQALQAMEFIQGGERTRMVLILREAMQHRMALEGRDLLITLSPAADTP